MRQPTGDGRRYEILADHVGYTLTQCQQHAQTVVDEDARESRNDEPKAEGGYAEAP